MTDRTKPKRAPDASEAALKLSILHALQLLPNVHAMRLNSGAARRGKLRLCEAGTPDFLVMLPHGRCVWLEAKRDDKSKPNVDQFEWHAMAARMRHDVHVVRSVQEAVDAVTVAMRGPVSTPHMESAFDSLRRIGNGEARNHVRVVREGARSYGVEDDAPIVQHIPGAMLPSGKGA